ncbi:hypothetical protein [Roseobacter weihaiensis]|uniref:hypothetical protein n=1 Tax=Roseobacter weihaiensis TaxID=2763262 RepID=UPI001D0BA7BB|nr:hypothetical protein [Roseobacter sp. H9]
MVAPLIHLCSWPGAGKYTIGRALAGRIGGRLLHNHLALDPANAVYDRSDPRHAPFRIELRALIYREAQDLPANVPIIVTDALEETPDDRALFAPTEALAAARNAPLRAFTLTIAKDENQRRLMDPARAARSKLMRPEVLERLRADCILLRPAGAISVDVTDLSPDAAAVEIARRLGLDAQECDA